MEGCIDLLAQKAGLDRWEIRWRNALDVGDIFTTGQVLEKSVGIRKTLAAVEAALRRARAPGPRGGHRLRRQEQRHRQRRRGVGQGAARRRAGRHGVALQRLHRDGPGPAHRAGAVRRRGDRAAGRALPAEGRLDASSSAAARPPARARRCSAAARCSSAAAKLRADLDAGRSLADLAGRVYAGDIVVDDTTALGARVPKVKTHTAFGYATQVCILDASGRVERVVAAHDVGRVVNPALCEGQIEGAVHMGLGYALTEELPLRGRHAGHLQAARARRPARARHAARSR